MESESSVGAIATQMETGEKAFPESSSPHLKAEKALSEANELLLEFEENSGMPRILKLRDQAHIEKLLESTHEDRSKMTASDCDDAALALSCYALYVNRVTQAEEATARIAASNVNREIASLLDRVSGYAFEERRLKAIALSSAATAFSKKQIQSEIRVARLKDLAKMVNEIARYFGAAAYGKRKHYD